VRIASIFTLFLMCTRRFDRGQAGLHNLVADNASISRRDLHGGAPGEYVFAAGGFAADGVVGSGQPFVRLRGAPRQRG
jgi:hypothetical protein